MKNYLFSPSTNSFYPAAIIERYKAANSLPNDAIEVEDEIFMTFTGEAPEGKIRGAVDGMPAWVDAPQPSQEQLVAEAVQQQNSLRAVADSEIAWLQDAVDVGIATDEESTLLAAWKIYRVQLMRVKTDAAPNIEWPTLPVLT